MSTSWSQRDVKKKAIQPFVDKACALRPALNHKTVHPIKATLQDEEVTLDTFRDFGFGRGDSGVLDFGSHYVGYLTIHLDVQGGPADAPAFLKVKMCEHHRELAEDSADYTGWLGKGWLQEEWFHIDEFPAVLQLPRRYALRYLKLEMLDTSPNFRVLVKRVTLDAVTAAPDKEVKPLNTEDKLLQKIDEVSIRTLRDCMQDVFEDGPKRDRRIWLGDLRLQAMVNAVTFQNFDLVKRCLYLFAGLIRDDGVVGSCLYAEPRLIVDNIFLLDYSLFFVSTLLDYYHATGDAETFRELAPTAIRQLEAAREYLQADGIVEPEGRYNCFVDWKDGLHKQAAMQGIWLYGLRCGVQLCRELGDQELAGRFALEYEQGKQAVQKILWDEEKKCFVSGPDRQISWASQIWMCLAGVREGQQAADLLKRAKQTENICGMVTPYLFHHYVQALMECGQQEQAIGEIKRYWGGMIEAGADTFWELYNPEDPQESPYGSNMVNSYCHAWSCTPSYLLRKIY